MLVLPLSVGRWIGFGDNSSQARLPSAAAFAGISIFGLSGLVNVILVVWTRPKILRLDVVPNNTSFEDVESLNEAGQRPPVAVQSIPLTPLHG